MSEPTEDTAEVLELLRAGKKIEAIKVHRLATGAGLKQAKEAVEALAKQHQIALASSGCALVVVAVALALAAVTALLLS